MKSFQLSAKGSCALLGICLAASAAAEQVYRCGNSYSQTPCAGATILQAEDARTDAQRIASREAVERDKAVAKSMETSRLQAEEKALAEEKSRMQAQARAEARARQLASKREREEALHRHAIAQKHPGKKRPHDLDDLPGVFTATVPAASKPARSR